MKTRKMFGIRALDNNENKKCYGIRDPAIKGRQERQE